MGQELEEKLEGWLMQLNFDPMDTPSEIISKVQSCPENLRDTWDYGFLCGIASGRLAADIVSGKRTDVPDGQLVELNNIIAALAH